MKKIAVGFLITLIGVGLSIFMSHGSEEVPLPPHGPFPVSAQNETSLHLSKQNLAAARAAHSEKTNSKVLSDEKQVADSPFTRTTEIASSPKLFTVDNKQYPVRTYKTMLMPNDPYANQWWVQSTGLPGAWDIVAGANPTTLAVLDTGFALQHEEFSGRWARNTDEQGSTTSEAASALNCTDRSLALNASCNLIDDDFDGIVDNEVGTVYYENPSRLNCTDQAIALNKSCNRIDDDGNGYVDDVTGWDFINNDNSVQAGENNPSGEGTTHGTMTAGVAAANGNNAKGIAGADWNTKILPIQVIDDDSYGDTRSVGRGIYYAISRNVDVISISLGSTQPDSYVRAAVQAALAQGITVIAASGNDGCDCISYPANYPEVIAVGALDQSNARAYFSSYGSNLDFIAPGVNFTVPSWRNYNGSSLYESGVSGTSFSTPLVAGTLTRLLSQRPNMTPLQQYAALTESLNRLSLTSSQTRTNELGFGTLNALASTNRVVNAQSDSIQYAFSPISRGDFLSAVAPTEPIGNGGIQKCASGIYGTTQIYELTKSGKTFFTVSQVEAYKAQLQGYTRSSFAYACMQQPGDAPQTVRTLDIFREFKNILTKQ